jgi:diguanylate cyclase (GGDEF)-like protein
MFSAQRLVAFGLALAAGTIVALAVLVVLDLTREDDLHRAAIAAQEVKDHLETLRLELNEVRNASRLAALTGDREAVATIRRRAPAIDADLRFLRERLAEDATLPTLDALEQSTRLLMIHAQSVPALRDQRGEEAALEASRDAERLAREAEVALAASLDAETQRINDRTLARLRVDQSLRRYVEWFVAASIAGLAALAVGFRRVQRREREARRRVEWLAHYDVVTGLPNRALLADRLAQEATRSARTGEAFAVLLFDLDGFKAVNDTWGHPAGDRLLAMAAERGRRSLRASDTLGRVGGDDFLALLPSTALDGAVDAAEKLRGAISAPYLLETGEAHVGVSIGISLYGAHGTDPEALQKAADAALYDAKREGKNRVRVAQRDPVPAAALPQAREAS